MVSTGLAWSQFGAVAWPLLAAVALGVAVLLLLLAIARRARAHATHLRARIVEVVAVPAAVALPLVFLGIAVRATPLPPGWIALLQHWLGIGVLLCVTWLAVRTVGALQRRIVREHPLEVADNLAARRMQTQARVMGGVAQGGIVLVGVALALMTFPTIRQIGTTLLASAGIIGLVAGIAAKPVFGNLIAGLQIAITQPIRLDDVVIVEGEWGRVEEITSAFVVVRVWDERRLIVPLQWFIEHPFENWTHRTAQLLGASTLWLDYRTPMAAVREALDRICKADERWDGRVCVAQVTDADPSTIQVRLLVSARNSGDLFDLRCAVREQMIDFLRTRHPEALPRLRMDLARGAEGADGDAATPLGHTARAGAGAGVAGTRSPGAEDVNAADVAASEAAATQARNASRD